MMQWIHSKERVEFGVCWGMGEIDVGVRVKVWGGALVVAG